MKANRMSKAAFSVMNGHGLGSIYRGKMLTAYRYTYFNFLKSIMTLGWYNNDDNDNVVI